MSTPFTLGIEEEFQLVKPQTGELCSSINSILEKGTPLHWPQVVSLSRLETLPAQWSA